MILLLLHYIGRLPKKKKRKKILVTLSLFLYLKKVYSFCRNKPFIKMGIFFFFSGKASWNFDMAVLRV